MHTAIDPKKQQERILALEREVADLQQTLGSNETAEEIVRDHIRSLHSYNEAKDAAQVLIGRLAEVKGTTIRQIHDDLDLTADC